MPSRKLSLIIGLNLLLLILALWLKPRFQTNDDVAMIYAYSGTNIFDQPTAVTAFSTKTWGLLMVFLYQIVPDGVEIYTIVFFILIFILNIIIHDKLLENISLKSPYFWIILIPVLVFITLNFYLELQFTMLAGLFCFSAVLLLVYQPSKIGRIAAYLCFICAALLRLDVVPVVLVFLLLLSLFVTFFIPSLIDSKKLILRRFGLLALIFIGVYSFDKAIHTETEKQFLEFNSFRSGIVDYNSHLSDPSILPDHWGKEELSLFKNWFYSDDHLYNSARSYAIKNSSHQSGLLEKVKQKYADISIDLKQLENGYFLCVLMLALVSLLFAEQWGKSLIFLSFAVLAYLFFYSLLSIFFKEPPFRVSFMLFTAGILLFIYFTSRKAEDYLPSKVRIVLAVLLLIIPFRSAMLDLSHRKTDIIKNTCTENYNQNLIYIHSPFYPFEVVDPFKVSTFTKRIKKVWLCSFSAHPTVRKTLSDFKFNNLTSDIIGKEKMVSFIMPVDSERWLDFKSSYIGFIAKRYHKNVIFEKVTGANHCFGFEEYKLKEKI